MLLTAPMYKFVARLILFIAYTNIFAIIYFKIDLALRYRPVAWPALLCYIFHMSDFVSHFVMRRTGHHFQATSAQICGDVALGENCSIWFNAVIRGDVAPITLGKNVNVQEGAVLHCDYGVPLNIEADVTIGHGAVVHCRSVGSGTLIGMKAVVLSGAVIGRHCIVAAGAVVSPGTVVPDGQVVMGVPGKVVRAVRPAELADMQANNRHYVELAIRHVECPDKYYKFLIP